MSSNVECSTFFIFNLAIHKKNENVPYSENHFGNLHITYSIPYWKR